MSSTPVLLQTPKMQGTSWSNSDAANTSKTIYTAGASGSKVVAVLATSTDGTARVFTVGFVHSAATFILGAETVAITAGTDGATKTTNLLDLIPGLPVDNDGQPYLYMSANDTLEATNITQVTSGKNVNISVIAADF